MPRKTVQEHPPSGADVLDAWVILHQTYALSAKYLDQHLSRTGISLAQAMPLLLLQASETPLAMTQLARYLVQEPQSVTSLADRLAKRGLITRDDDPRDRRRVLLSLTAAGRQLAEALRLAAEQGAQDVLSVLTASEEERWAALLRAIAHRSAGLVSYRPMDVDYVDELLRAPARPT